jgi:hypothetical protein
MTRNRCTLQRSPTTRLVVRNAAYHATPSIRKATMTTLLPGQVRGFPPVRGGGWERGTPKPFRKERRHPQASPCRCRTSQQGFLPSAKKPPPQTIRSAPPNLPPTFLRLHDLGNHPRRLTAVTNTRPKGRKLGQREHVQQQRSHAGGNCLHRAPSRQPNGRDNMYTPGPN